jgi:hypothetical protein
VFIPFPRFFCGNWIRFDEDQLTRITRNRKYKNKREKKEEIQSGSELLESQRGTRRVKRLLADVLAAAGATRATALGFQLL